MKTPDGGPAFPCPASTDQRGGNWTDGEDYLPDQQGMSLRDWFAGQALVGLLAFSPPAHNTQLTPEEAAPDAYTYADAMLAARNKNKIGN